MFTPTQSTIDTRFEQMFPVLEPAEIERVRRFGKLRSYGPGEALAKVGETGHGMWLPQPLCRVRQLDVVLITYGRGARLITGPVTFGRGEARDPQAPPARRIGSKQR